ncbi:MAG: VOC family protein [Acidimicrobiales bacterium]
MTGRPKLRSIVLDATDARALAEFYRQLLGFGYRPGDEPPPAGAPDPAGADWLVLVDPSTDAQLAFQQVDELPPSTWPAPDVPQQLHLDLSVADVDALHTQRDRALALGATIRLDRSDDPDEPLYALADPTGHPFCIFVVPEPGPTASTNRSMARSDSPRT